MKWIWIVIPLILVGIVGIQESFAQELEIIASPKHQLESGILPDDIQCRDNRILVLRPNGNPACLTPQTAEKLMERGWTISLTNVEDKKPTNTIPVDLDSSNIIDANNQFAIDFYSQVSQESDQNIFFSPWSIMTAFAIVSEGARGNTAEEMQNVFGFSSNKLQRQNEFKSVNDELNQEDSSYSLQVANALWLADFFEPLKEYVDIAKKYYDSEVSAVDFVGNEGVDTINSWAAEKTNDKIKTILPPGSTDALTRLVITNAIYFKGTWVTQFNEENTREQNFTVDSDNIIKTPMMNLYQNQHLYGETENIKILELPYEGEKLSMLLLLPKEIDGIADLENSLTIENLNYWKDSLLEQELQIVSIPKFELETKYDLIP
ncbi:MAG: serpin family protein, partial [Nitrosopumilaceae archaeon]